MRRNSVDMQQRRQRRKRRTRAKIFGTAARPRMSVFRSLRFTNVQLIDDAAGTTLWSGTTQTIAGAKNKTQAAFQLGELAAAGARAQGITRAVFDRGRYRYHGRVKAAAEAARKGGLLM